MATTNPNFKNRKTPGVYITEFDAFPQAVVGVQTAVPAFIGYTQTAVRDGKSVFMQPIALSSMADYEQVFGKEYNPLYDINMLSSSPPPANADFTVNGEYYVVVEASGQPQFNLYYSMRMFFANGGSSCYVVSVGDYSNPVAKDPLLAGLNAISYQVGPTMLVIPDAVNLPASPPGADSTAVPQSQDFVDVTRAMLDQCVALQDRVAIFDIYGSTAVTQGNVDFDLDPCIAQFQEAIINPSPSYGMAYFPFLNTTIVEPSDFNYTNFAPSQAPLVDLSPPITTELQDVLTLFNQEQYPDTIVNGKVVQNPTQLKIQQYIDSIDQKADHDSVEVASLNNILTNSLGKYSQLLAVVARKAGVLPPSGAMAGVYALNDQNRGVWNAPANMVLASTISPTVSLSDDQQGGLNVPINGKAIDVIRDFVGRGPVVWGARTLDGNSLDWRYIQVRRTIIYVEQSIKAAINQFVFAPNVATTWVSVTQMISGFLQDLWSRGGLMGDKASDAFSVLCGVPATMTATDILNGYMVVQVTLQMVHPAEFIELTFKQTMQG